MNFQEYWLSKTNLLKWIKRPRVALIKKKNNYFEWFPDGIINVYSNSVEQHLSSKNKNKIAIYFVDKKNKITSLTYHQLDNEVNKFCFYLTKTNKDKKINKIMIHASSSFCAKLGIHFTVIFEDLPLEAIKKRIEIFKPDIIFSSLKDINQGNFDFKKKQLKKIKVIYFKDIKLGNIRMVETNKKTSSSDNFFSIFTSGSTGDPKGITHCYGGFLLSVVYTCKKQFGMKSNSVVLTASDAGWINGHNYALFGPLTIGATTILVEKPITLLNEKLLKKLFKLRISILYLPVTLIRLMKKIFKENHQHNLKVTLGSMGEPLAPSVGDWFSKNFSDGKRAIVNTYYQTETGAIISSPKYNESSKNSPHGTAGKPINKYLKISKLNKIKKNEIKIHNLWPGCMIDILNGFKEWKKYWDNKGNFRMFDLATVKNNNIIVHGRLDDVINIRGHRIGSEELESIVLKIKEIFECCAISVGEETEGHVFYLFVVSDLKDLDNKINSIIKSNFGVYALPKNIYYLRELPKTRSGKILRRLLRDILLNPDKKNYGNLSTILNHKVVDEIKYVVNK
jgi:acetyl-CoA synthetase